MFSVPMLFFMGSSAHLPSGALSTAAPAAIGVVLLIIAALQGNAIFGKQGPLTTVNGVVACAFGLWLVLFAAIRSL